MRPTPPPTQEKNHPPGQFFLARCHKALTQARSRAPEPVCDASVTGPAGSKFGPVPHLPVGAGEAVVEAASGRIIGVRHPVGMGPSIGLRQREQVVGERPAGAARYDR